MALSQTISNIYDTTNISNVLSPLPINETIAKVSTSLDITKSFPKFHQTFLQGATYKGLELS